MQVMFVLTSDIWSSDALRLHVTLGSLSYGSCLPSSVLHKLQFRPPISASLSAPCAFFCRNMYMVKLSIQY